MKDWLDPPKPYAIAHRGASAYAPDNTLEAFALASDMGAEFWEIDIRRTADGVLVVFHDEETADGRAVGSQSYTAFEAATEANGGRAPRLDEVLDLAVARRAGIYADIKDLEAAVPAALALRDAGIEKAILGAFDPEAVRRLAEAGVDYPRAALVPLGADPFEHAAGADLIHLCWERMERPQDTLTPDFLARAKAAGQRVVLWHEEDPDRMADLRDKPIFGICSDTPQLVRPFRAPEGWPVKVVAHRGAKTIAPENTCVGAEAAFAAGADIVELDVRTTADGVLVAMHDAELDRTTNGSGLVADWTYDRLYGLDAGRWFGRHFANTRVPTLEAMMAVATRFGRGLYVEIKDADPERVVEVVGAAGHLETSFFWSYRPSWLLAVRNADPRARVMVPRGMASNLDELLETYRPAIVEYKPDDDFSDFNAVRAAGAEVMIHYPGQTPAFYDRVIAARPDLVNIGDLFTFRRRVSAAGYPTDGA
ncbi:MAG: glycerophosphodiester phosphodiesterase family protein [Pseudomonadota bacterium]